jgi:cation transport ATPase
MDPLPTWVSGYRGLWGLYAGDPFEGEDAPAGPMYDRDKTISREWYDPVGWAGLDKVPTRPEELDVILKRQANIEARCVRLRAEILEKGSRLKALGIEAEATRDRSHLKKLHETQMRHIDELSKEVQTMRAELSNDEVLHESLEDHAERLRNGERPSAGAHIMRAARPVSEAETHAGRVAQLWASISVAVVLLTLIGIFAFQRQQLLSALVFAIAVFAFVEASFRRRLTRFVGSANVGLAMVGALVLLQHFFWQIIVFAVLSVGLYILWDNLRELGR